MKASELIKELQELVLVHSDVTVISHFVNSNEFQEVESVYISNNNDNTAPIIIDIKQYD